MVIRKKTKFKVLNVHCKLLFFVGAVFGPVGQLLFLTLVGQYTQHVAGPRAILFGMTFGVITLPPDKTDMYRLSAKRGDTNSAPITSLYSNCCRYYCY